MVENAHVRVVLVTLVAVIEGCLRSINPIHSYFDLSTLLFVASYSFFYKQQSVDKL